MAPPTQAAAAAEAPAAPEAAAAPALPEPLLPAESAGQLAGRCATMMEAALSALCVYMGHELGLYKALKAAGGPITSTELAERAGNLSERWVREWLHQASAARLVCCDKGAARFWMTPAQAEVLVEADSLQDARESPLEMLLRMPTVLGKHQELLGAFRTGVGLSYDDTGIDHCHMHRHARAVQLVKGLQSLPGLTDKLQAGVRVADVGCGSGEALLHLASLFPASTFVGYDISRRALSTANEHKQRQGLTNVTFLNPDDGPGSRLPAEPTFHLVIVLDAIHDMTRPDHMLQAIRQSLLPDTDALAPSSSPQQPSADLPDALTGYCGGPAFVCIDIKSLGSPARNIAAMPTAPLVYGISLGICMSSATSEPGGAGLGTVGWHEGKAREMAAAAGFSSFSTLNWQDSPWDFHSYYFIRGP